MKALTKQQAQVMTIILDYHAKNGVAPTQRVIADIIGRSQGGVNTLVSELEKKEWLVRDETSRRIIPTPFICPHCDKPLLTTEVRKEVSKTARDRLIQALFDK